MKTRIAFLSVALMLGSGAAFADSPGGGVQSVSAPLTKAGTRAGITKADAAHDGYLSHADWSKFNTGSSGTSGGVTINPATLGTLSTWLKADAGTYSDTGCTVAATNGNAVACWKDQSANALAFIQVTAGARPRYVTNTKSSSVKFAMDAPAGAAALYTADATGLSNQNFTVCTVTKEETISGGNATIFGVWNNTGPKGWFHGISSGYATRATVNYDGTVLSSSFLRAFIPETSCTTFDSATKVQTLWLDGYPVSTRTATSGVVDYTGAQGVVGALTSSTSEYFNGEILEVLYYDSVLSPAMLGSAYRYTQQRWDVGNFSADGGSTSGGGGGGITSATAPLVVTGADVSIPAATNSVNGYLTAADHTTFAGYAPTCDAQVSLPSGTVTKGALTSMTRTCSGNATTDACYIGIPSTSATIGDMITLAVYPAGSNNVRITATCNASGATCAMAADTARVICHH